MDYEKFEVVVHHMGSFSEPNHLGYYGMESTWICHPDAWSYLGVLGGLKDMGYIDLESLWYYHPQDMNELIRLNSDVGTKRMRYIAYNDGCAHLYVLHTMSEPVVEEYPTLEYFIQGPPSVRSNEVKGSGITMKGGPSNVVDNESGPNIEVDKESGPSNVGDVGGGSFNEGQAFNRDESENVSPTEGAEEDSEDDSAFEVTFGDPEEEGVRFDAYFGEAPQSEPEPSQCVQAEPEPKPSHHTEDNPHTEPTVLYQTQPTPDNSQYVPSVQTDTNPTQTQTDINSQAANPTQTQNDKNSQPANPTQTQTGINLEAANPTQTQNDTNSQPANPTQTQTDINSEAANPTQTQNDTNSQPAQQKKKRGRPKKKPVTLTERVEEPLAETVISESSNPPQFGLSDNEDCNSEHLNSDCDSDDSNSKSNFPTFKLLDSMFEYKWEVGTYFVSKQQFQEGIRTYAVHNGKDIKFRKNDKTRVRAICKKNGCKWEAFCAKRPGEETWQLRKILDVCKCPWDYSVSLMSSRWLGGKLNNSVRENPSIRLGDIIEKTNHRFHMSISKTKAYRARSHAKDLVDGSYREQYTRMHDYCHELFRSNPGSTVKVTSQPFQGGEGDLENPDTVMCPHFQRVYICFKACNESFKSCRPIIGLDGCFLKGYYGGQLLTAIGRDPNDQMLPIAYVVVEGETKDT